MNRTQTLAVVLMAALLPFTSAAFASDRGHDGRDRGRDRGHGYGHQHHGHHSRHYCRHDDRRDFHHYGRGHGAGVVLPFPPLPPFPLIVLNKKHHTTHVELPHSR